MKKDAKLPKAMFHSQINHKDLPHKGLKQVSAMALLATTFAALWGILPNYAYAQDENSLSFQSAKMRMEEVSPLLQAADHKVKAGQQDVLSVQHLNMPVVSVSATAMEYQKTINVDLSDVKNNVESSATDFLNGLPDMVPPAYSDIAAEIAAQIGQALPGLSSVIPNNYRFKVKEGIFRPAASIFVPIYTGGAIPAVQNMAQSKLATAQAEAIKAQSLVQVNLVQSYFGVELAQQLLQAATDSRDAFDRYLHDAKAMEREGVIPHVRVLQVQVGRDTTERVRKRAELDYKNALDTLSRLLELDAVGVTTTPLFVHNNALPPIAEFEATASEGNSDVRLADATGDMAGAGTELAKSQKRPKVFGFGSYNFNRNKALLIDPDWTVGIGVSYTLYSGFDRDAAIRASQERQLAANAAADAQRRNTLIAVNTLYNQVDKARYSYQLLASNINAARENVRVQEIAFKAGEGTISDLMTARAALTTAITERYAAAYEYDVALASLLSLSNRDHEFIKYVQNSDTN